MSRYIRDRTIVAKAKLMGISAQLNVDSYSQMLEHEPREFEWLRIDTNYNCNVQCVYCHSRRSDESLSNEQLTRFFKEKVLKLDNVQFGCVMEPTLDPRLTDLMELASKVAKPDGDMVVQTNGLLLHTHPAERMRDAGMTHLSVSLDTINPTTLARLRGGSSFNKVARNVADFVSKIPTVKLQILTTVNKANLDELEELVRWGIELGAAKFVLREIFHYPNNRVVNHEETVKLLLDPGDCAAMQERMSEKFVGTDFYFAPRQDLLDHVSNVHKISYQTQGKRLGDAD